MAQPIHAFDPDLIRLSKIRDHLSNAEYQAILREINSDSSVLTAYKYNRRKTYVSGPQLSAFLTSIRKPATSAEWFFHHAWSQDLANKLYHCVNLRKNDWKNYFAGPKDKCPARFSSPESLRRIKPRYVFFCEVLPDIKKFLTVNQIKNYRECLRLVREKVDEFLQGKNGDVGLLDTYRPAYPVDYERLYTYFLDNCILGVDIQTVFKNMKTGRKDRERAVNNSSKEFIDGRFEANYESFSIDESNLGFSDHSNQEGMDTKALWQEEIAKLFEGEDEVDIEIFRLRALHGMGWLEICEEIQDVTKKLKTGPSVAYRFHQTQERLRTKFHNLDFTFTKYSPYSKQEGLLSED